MNNLVKDFRVLEDKMYVLQALLETTGIALYAIQCDKNPGAKAATISSVVDQAAKMCEENLETVRKFESLLIKNSDGKEG